MKRLLRLPVGSALLLLVALTGCDDRPHNLLNIHASRTIAAGATVTATVEMPGVRLVFSDSQLVDQGVGLPVTARSGDIRIQFVATKSVTDTIARGEVSLRITPGNNYSAFVNRQGAQIGNACFGCTGTIRYPLAGSESASTDSLWLYYLNSPPLCKGCLTEMRRAAADARRVAQIR